VFKPDASEQWEKVWAFPQLMNSLFVIFDYFFGAITANTLYSEAEHGNHLAPLIQCVLGRS